MKIELETVGKGIVDCAYKVHRKLGPGLLEGVYETCFCYELQKHGLGYMRQVSVPIFYDELKLDTALRLDILVEDLIICELKAVDVMLPVFEAQLLSYLRLSKKRLGYLINFHAPLIKNGIRRLIL
jgi:GxxExxY protein